MSSRVRPVIALIDCNNFFASCERIFRPDLWDKPVVVLSNNDGVIVARSNEVKAMGVGMAEPYFKFKGILKANNTTVFSANFSLYGDMSQRVTDIMKAKAPHVEVYSIDESFAELSELATDDFEGWAVETRAAILRATGIPVSIGVGYSKTLAKAAADYAKKHTESGTHVALEEADREKLLTQLPLNDIWGIGRRLTPRLQRFGMRTALDLAKAPEKWVLKELTVKGLSTVKELNGEAIIPLDKKITNRKTIERSRSFGHVIRNSHQLESAVASFTATAAARLRRQNSVCSGVVTYLRTKKHVREAETESHENATTRRLATLTPLPEPSADTGQLITAALNGFNRIHDPDFAYEKAGIVLVGIQDIAAWQLSLLEGSGKDRDKSVRLMGAVDNLNKLFGPGTVWHASQEEARAKWRSKRERVSPAYTTKWSDLPMLKI